jgi:hypothetical protein
MRGFDQPVPPPGGGAPHSRSANWRPLGVSLAWAVAVAAGTALLGVLAGFGWEKVSPRALVVVTGAGAANVVNPETSAFIAADGWFILLSLLGGIASGLAGYLLAVRKYGPVPMAGVLVGGLAAAWIAAWTGQQAGMAGFNHRLAVSAAGTVLRAPVTLGGHGPLAFWPLAAGVVAGGIEAGRALRERRRLARLGAGPPLPGPDGG